MKINYEFVTGEKLGLEVDDSIGEIVIEMEVSQCRRNRTETRRHNSLEAMQEQQPGRNPTQFMDEKTDIEQAFGKPTEGMEQEIRFAVELGIHIWFKEMQKEGGPEE